MIRDRDYWQSYYDERKALTTPSPFAKYVLRNYLRSGMRLLELGCGNARDSIFFAMHGINTTAVDQCAISVSDLPIAFLQRDFTRLPNDIDPDVIYSRFSLHSVDKPGYTRTMSWLALRTQGILCIEARGKKNEYYGIGRQSVDDPAIFEHEGHQRRFLDFDELVTDIEKAGYAISYAKERKGFAPYKGTNQTLIRVVSMKR